MFEQLRERGNVSIQTEVVKSSEVNMNSAPDRFPKRSDNVKWTSKGQHGVWLLFVMVPYVVYVALRVFLLKDSHFLMNNSQNSQGVNRALFQGGKTNKLINGLETERE